MAMLLALDRNLRVYARTVDKERRWQYYAAPTPMGLHGSTLGLFGFGKIGRSVAQRARAFGMRVLASDIHADPAQAKKLGVELADADTLLRESDVISNHMNLTPENTHYFSDARFRQMAKHPIFLNAAHGGSVDEAALIRTLDSGLIRAAGLDVLEAEKPNLADCGLLGRENVIVTPHAAFYSARSMEALQQMSCRNLTDCLTGNRGHAFKIVNNVAIS